MSQSVEAAIVAAGATVAPRITPAGIEANITHTEIVKHVSPSGKVLRWAVLTCQNGFAVTGRPSASVSVENDRAEIGEMVAIENAKSEMWALMGYALASELTPVPASYQGRVEIERHELNQKIQKLTAFLSTDTFAQLLDGERDRLLCQQAAMLDYYGCLLERIRAFSANGG